jgi:hypothetical protein
MSQAIQQRPDQSASVQSKEIVDITEDATYPAFADLIVDEALTPVEVKIVEAGDHRTARPFPVVLTELQCEV